MAKTILRAFLEVMVLIRILLNCKPRFNQLNFNHRKLICVSMCNLSLQTHRQLLQYFLICLPTQTMHQSRINKMDYPITYIRVHTLLMEIRILELSQIYLLLHIIQIPMGLSQPWPRPLNKNLCPT